MQEHGRTCRLPELYAVVENRTWRRGARIGRSEQKDEGRHTQEHLPRELHNEGTRRETLVPCHFVRFFEIHVSLPANASAGAGKT